MHHGISRSHGLLHPHLRYGRVEPRHERLVPTGSFKARGAAVGDSLAHELGVTGIAMPIALPVDAPVITRRECVVTGAELYFVDGLIADESGWAAETDEVVMLNTGSGLLYPDTVPIDVPTSAKSGTIPPSPHRQSA